LYNFIVAIVKKNKSPKQDFEQMIVVVDESMHEYRRVLKSMGFKNDAIYLSDTLPLQIDSSQNSSPFVF
jgi:hypothetical protein